MTTIEQNVMASVRVIYVLRRLTSATALKLYVCAASLWGIGQLVFVSKVFENLSHVGTTGSLQFALAAFFNTELMVQLVLLAATLAVISLFVDVFRSFSFRSFAS